MFDISESAKLCPFDVQPLSRTYQTIVEQETNDIRDFVNFPLRSHFRFGSGFLVSECWRFEAELDRFAALSPKRMVARFVAIHIIPFQIYGKARKREKEDGLKLHFTQRLGNSRSSTT